MTSNRQRYCTSLKKAQINLLNEWGILLHQHTHLSNLEQKGGAKGAEDFLVEMSDRD